jgi:hypothetical protein
MELKTLYRSYKVGNVDHLLYLEMLPECANVKMKKKGIISCENGHYHVFNTYL